MVDKAAAVERLGRLSAATRIPIGPPLRPTEIGHHVWLAEAPPEYREWLSVSNGSRLPPGGYYGVDTGDQYTDVSYYYRIFPTWLEKRWIPVASDACGNYYVLDSSGEHKPLDPVYFIDCTSRSTDQIDYVVASGLWRFLASILGRELGEPWHLFDREHAISRDPDLMRLRGVPMAWEVGHSPVGRPPEP